MRKKHEALEVSKGGTQRRQMWREQVITQYRKGERERKHERERKKNWDGLE